MEKSSLHGVNVCDIELKVYVYSSPMSDVCIYFYSMYLSELCVSDWNFSEWNREVYEWNCESEYMC